MKRGHWLLATVLATAPVYVWMGRRMVDGSDEPWGLLAAATGIGLVVAKHNPAPPHASLVAPGIVLALYAVSYTMALPLVRAVLATITSSLLLSRLYLGRRFDLGLTGLCLLTLPLSASLHFFVGYPLRALVARLAALALNAGGLAVSARGVGLEWGAQLVVVDAPCSGIKMLWVGAFVTCALSVALDLSLRRCLLAGLGALIVIVGGNALRAAALFYSEAGLVAIPRWAHDAAGLAVFAGIAASIAALTLHLAPPRRPSSTMPCSEPST